MAKFEALFDEFFWLWLTGFKIAFDGTPTVSGKTLNYTLADDDKKVGSTGTITVPVTSTNYKDFALTIVSDSGSENVIFTPSDLENYGEAHSTVMPKINPAPITGAVITLSETAYKGDDGTQPQHHQGTACQPALAL